jgi:tetratricopeptide (TPR) repeat protein
LGADQSGPSQDAAVIGQAKKTFRQSTIREVSLGPRISPESCSRARKSFRAKEQYEIALSIYMKIGNRKGVADELDNLSDVRFALGNLETSRRSYEQSLVANDEIGNQDGIALAKGALGPVLLALGDHEGAKRSSQASLEICQRIGDRSKAAIAMAGVGDALRVEGNIADAQTYETQAVSMFNEIGDKRSAARFQLLVAELLIDQGDNSGATTLARQSADEFERERAVRDQAVAYAMLGRAYLAQHDLSAAGSALNNSTSLAGKYTDRSVELFVELTAALVHSSSGRSDEEKALNDFVVPPNRALPSMRWKVGLRSPTLPLPIA